MTLVPQRGDLVLVTSYTSLPHQKIQTLGILLDKKTPPQYPILTFFSLLTPDGIKDVFSPTKAKRNVSILSFRRPT